MNAIYSTSTFRYIFKSRNKSYTSPDKPSREWTCILYLNSNYHGGRTYIPDAEVFEPMMP